MKGKRIYYKTGECTINGIPVHGLSEGVGFKTNFHLEQCFCSCPLPLESIRKEYRSWCDCCSMEVQMHYDHCPNAKPELFIREVTKEECNEYKRYYSKRD